jgi:hypothetical protein
MRNVKFEGVDEDLTAPGTPWIYFGVGFRCSPPPSLPPLLLLSLGYALPFPS